MTNWKFVKSGVGLGLFVLASGLGKQTSAADLFNGQTMYEQRCTTCHDANGKARIPGVPDLRRFKGVIRTDDQWVERLKKGKGGCPPFRGLIRDKDLADVAAYLRALRR